MPLETFQERWPENIEGKFYVDSACLDCDLCRETAPQNFARSDDGGYSFIFSQPKNEEELILVQESIEGCPCEAIFSDGDSFDWQLFEAHSYVVGSSRAPKACKHCAATIDPMVEILAKVSAEQDAAANP